MKTKLNAIVQAIAVKKDEMEVALSGSLYTYMIKYDNVDWFPQKNGNSILGEIRAGTKIEFNNDIHPAVRELHNVSIILP